MRYIDLKYLVLFILLIMLPIRFACGSEWKYGLGIASYLSAGNLPLNSVAIDFDLFTSCEDNNGGDWRLGLNLFSPSMENKPNIPRIRSVSLWLNRGANVNLPWFSSRIAAGPAWDFNEHSLGAKKVTTGNLGFRAEIAVIYNITRGVQIEPAVKYQGSIISSTGWNTDRFGLLLSVTGNF